MPKSRKNPKHPWFKRKGYLHLDKALMRKEAQAYVTNPDNILRHRFSPLIHYGKISRKVERNKEAEKAFKDGGPKPELIAKEKIRNIFYTSHVDGYIYSYYTHQIQRAYETFLKKQGLDSNIIAYRPISKNGVKYCNVHFAKEAFDFVASLQSCHVLCFDISKFFDKLSVHVLKNKWAQVLEQPRLPDDHFKVYESLVNFRYIEEGHLIECFKGRFAKNPRQHGLDKESGGSRRHRICDYYELREASQKFKTSGRRLIKKKESAAITGIPQGTAISGLLSNVFMLDFDCVVKKHVEDIGGFYRRYSDDIFIAVPCNTSFEEIDALVKEQLKKFCGSSIQLNDKKTERRVYIKGTNDTLSSVTDQNGVPARIQYLGFHFDGERIYIRNSSISKDRGKTIQSLRKHKNRDGKIDTASVYREKSSREVTPYNKMQKKGFVYYAHRAAKIHGEDNIIRGQIKKNDRFIQRAKKRETEKNSHS